MKNTSYIANYINYLNTYGRSENTILAYQNCLFPTDKFLQENYQLSINDSTITQVKGMHLLSFIQSLDSLSVTTINYYTTVLKAYFTFLARAGIIPTENNPTLVLHYRKQKIDEVAQSERYFENIYNATEIKALFDSLSNRNKLRNQTILAILFSTGLRASELCSLRFGDIRNMQQGTFACVRKGGGRYRVPMGKLAMPYVEEWLEANQDKADSDYLFMSQKGKPLNRHSLYFMVSDLQKKIGKPTGTHKIRHAFLTELQRSCSDMALVRDVASHSNSNITDRYTHTSLQSRLNAVNGLSWEK